MDLAIAELGPPDGRSMSRIAEESTIVTIGNDGFMFDCGSEGKSTPYSWRMETLLDDEAPYHALHL